MTAASGLDPRIVLGQAALTRLTSGLGFAAHSILKSPDSCRASLPIRLLPLPLEGSAFELLLVGIEAT